MQKRKTKKWPWIVGIILLLFVSFLIFVYFTYEPNYIKIDLGNSVGNIGNVSFSISLSYLDASYTDIEKCISKYGSKPSDLYGQINLMLFLNKTHPEDQILNNCGIYLIRINEYDKSVEKVLKRNISSIKVSGEGSTAIVDEFYFPKCFSSILIECSEGSFPIHLYSP